MAAAGKPRFWDYLKAAFSFGPVVPGLGRMPVNALAVLAIGVAGAVFSPGIWLIGAAAELGYLTFATNDRRFRRLVEIGFSPGETTARADDRREQLLFMLDFEERKRHATLEAKCREVAHSSMSTASGASLDTGRVQALSRLSWIFLKLLVSKKLVQDKVRAESKSEIEGKLKETETRLASPEAGDDTSPVRRTLESTAELLRRRLENLKRGTERVMYCDSELDRIEQQVALLVEEAALSKDAEGFGYRVDAVASTLDESQTWMLDPSASLDGVDLEAPPDILRTGERQAE